METDNRYLPWQASFYYTYSFLAVKKIANHVEITKGVEENTHSAENCFRAVRDTRSPVRNDSNIFA